jgi:hypothetical protein
MGLLSVWKERKEVSPHQPRRARTWRLLAGLVFVGVLIWLLEQVA